MRLFDSHAHFGSFVRDGTAGDVLRRAAEAGIGRLLAVGASPAENEAALAARDLAPERVRVAVGLDRDQAEASPDLATLAAQLDRPGVAALGEIGLDYHYTPRTAAAQRALMERQLAMARERGRPVVVHSREADADTLGLLAAHAAAWRGDPARIGVVHCFTGGPDFARRLLDLGCCLGFSGIATFPKSGSLRDVVRLVPADRLMIETDSPYLAPVPVRGRTNEPAFLPHTAACLAEARGETVEALAGRTWAVASALFWPDE